MDFFFKEVEKLLTVGNSEKDMEIRRKDRVKQWKTNQSALTKKEEVGVVQEEVGVVQEEVGVVQEIEKTVWNAKIAESPFSILWIWKVGELVTNVIIGFAEIA